MADVLIKGMKMPKACDCCPLCKTESAFHGICQAIRNDICYVYPDKEKPLWCPLVEVPAHGRLIDADELLKDKVSNAYISRFEVDYAPTVIEASEDGEQDGKL